MAQTISTISDIAFVAAIITAIIAIVLFFRFKIPRVISELSGRTSKRSIEEIRKSNEDKHKALQNSKVDLDVQHVKKQADSAVQQQEETSLLEETDILGETDITAGTTLLEETEILEETTIISEDDGTTILSELSDDEPFNDETDILDLLQDNSSLNKKKIEIIEDITITNTEETI